MTLDFLVSAASPSLSAKLKRMYNILLFNLNGLLPETGPLLLIESELFSDRLRDKNTTLVSSRSMIRLHFTHVTYYSVPQNAEPVGFQFALSRPTSCAQFRDLCLTASTGFLMLSLLVPVPGTTLQTHSVFLRSRKKGILWPLI